MPYISSLTVFKLTLFKVRTAAKRKVGFGELQKSWRTETAGARSLAVVFFNCTMACAASYMTISLLCRKQLSIKSNIGVPDLVNGQINVLIVSPCNF